MNRQQRRAKASIERRDADEGLRPPRKFTRSAKQELKSFFNKRKHKPGKG